MYHAHSKDINRNKSFHPLTYANLRRVEKLKEAEEAKQQQRAERAKELQRDQEERRYDALVLEDGAGELDGRLARFRQVKNIFAAEYDDATTGNKEAEVKQQQLKKGETEVKVERDVRAEVPRQFGGALAKFHKQDSKGDDEEKDASGTKAEGQRTISHTHDEVASASNKRPRETSTRPGQASPSSSSSTGYITTAEAVQLRRELDLVKKQRLDPLRKVEQFHNDTVAAAARAQAMAERKRQQQREEEEEELKKKKVMKGEGSTNGALKEHIKAMLNMKKEMR